jgi:hypothetical protein
MLLRQTEARNLKGRGPQSTFVVSDDEVREATFKTHHDLAINDFAILLFP